MRSKAHTALTVPLVLHHTRIYKCTMKKIIINGRMRNKPFLIVIYHSSLVKAAMNAARVCKLRNGVNKTPQYLFFQWPKQCWGSEMFIPDPGSWFLPIQDPGSRISDPGSKNSNKREGWKKVCCHNFYWSHRFTKLQIILVLMCWRKKIWANF